MTPDQFLFTQPDFIKLFLKIIVLAIIVIVAISAFMLATKIRSFNRVLFLPPKSGGEFVQRIAIIYFFIVVVLFLFALIML